MKNLIISLLLLCGCAEGMGGNFHTENDFFDPFQKNIDRYYTHSTRFGVTNEKENQKESYSIGQNIYTPSTKKPDADTEVLKRDRPYAGWFYAEYRNTYNSAPSVQTTYGIQLGCTGPCSQAKETQQGVHKILGQGIPAWQEDFQLNSEPGFILELEREKRFYTYKDNFDASIYGLGKFGNIIDNASLGSLLRLGYNLDTFQSTPIVFKATFPPKEDNTWMAYFFTKVEERAVAYNHLLDGSLWQEESHTVTSRPFVNEINLGFTVGYKKFKFTYTWFRFSSEWEERQAPVAFSGLDFNW